MMICDLQGLVLKDSVASPCSLLDHSFWEEAMGKSGKSGLPC